MGAAFALAGTAGLVLLKTTVVAGTAFVVWRRLRGASPPFGPPSRRLPSRRSAAHDDRRRRSGRCSGWPCWCRCSTTVDRQAADPGLRGALRPLGEPARRAGSQEARRSRCTSRSGAVRARRCTGWLVVGGASLAATLVNPMASVSGGFSPRRCGRRGRIFRSGRPSACTSRRSCGSRSSRRWRSSPSAAQPRDRPAAETCAVVLLLVGAGLRVSRVAPLVCPACLALLGPSITRAWGDLARLTAPTPAAAMVLFLPRRSR